MSLRVVGYQDGRRITIDEGEARARVAGYSGSALGHAITAAPKPRERPKRLPRAPLNRVRVLCAFLMPRGAVCARGRHKDVHHRAAVLA